MAGILERSYGRILGGALETVAPFKNVMLKAECRVHKFINHQAVNILSNDGNDSAWLLSNKYSKELDYGVVWVDQDMRSRNHFYNPYTKRGFYGFSNAMRECIAYYNAAVGWWHRNNPPKAFACLGAACHLVQDMTVPQHVNVTLMDNHRRFEKWVIETHEKEGRFKCCSDGLYLNAVKDYINSNAYAALNVYRESTGIGNLEYRFFNIAGKMLLQAQKSTAGLLQLFFNDVNTDRDGDSS